MAKMEDAIIEGLAHAGVDADVLLLSAMNLVIAMVEDHPYLCAITEEMVSGILKSMLSKAPDDATKANLPKLTEHITVSMQPVVATVMEAMSEMTTEQNAVFALGDQ